MCAGERRPSSNCRHLLVYVAFLFYYLIITDVIKADDVITIACLVWNVTLRHWYKWYITILEDWGRLSWSTKWALQNLILLIAQTRLCSLVKKRVYEPRKDIFFYLYSDAAQYSLKFPARVVPTPLFLPIYVIMTSLPQKLAKFFTFVDFYFVHSHFSYGWTWIFNLGSLNKWDMGNLQMHLWR